MMNMRRAEKPVRFGYSLLFTSIIFLSLVNRAEAQGQKVGLYSIEPRDLMGRHEIAASVGVLPMDAFAKGVTLKGNYAYHFNHLFGWELISGLWSFNYENDLKQRLKDNFNVQPTDVGELRWILDSSFVLRPLYGKLAWFNNTLLNGELFFVLGYALGGYTAATPSGLDVGSGLRIFLNRYFSFRLDIRDYIFFPERNTMANNLFISLGLSLTFGISDENSEL